MHGPTSWQGGREDGGREGGKEEGGSEGDVHVRTKLKGEKNVISCCLTGFKRAHN